MVLLSNGHILLMYVDLSTKTSGGSQKVVDVEVVQKSLLSFSTDSLNL